MNGISRSWAGTNRIVGQSVIRIGGDGFEQANVPEVQASLPREPALLEHAIDELIVGGVRAR